MKKFMITCLALVLMMSMSLTAFAAGFVESPSLNPAPTLVSFYVDSEECEADLVITAYSQRSNLSEEGRVTIEGVYDDIKNATDISTLSADLAAVANSLNVATADLSVSDLFDISYMNCDPETHTAEHGSFHITLRAETLDNFVGILHFTDGAYELVSDAKVNENGDLTMSVDSLSPFAIVVGPEKSAPDTGDNSMIYMWGILAAVSALAVVICLKEAKKNAQ